MKTSDGLFPAIPSGEYVNELHSLLSFSREELNCNDTTVKSMMRRKVSMHVLPEEVIDYIFQFLDVDELVQAELVCKDFQTVMVARDVWKCFAHRSFIIDPSSGHRHAFWKKAMKRHQLFRFAHRKNRKNLISEAEACSSLDRHEENPSHTLVRSTCLEALSHFDPLEDPARVPHQLTGVDHQTTMFFQMLHPDRFESPGGRFQHQCGCAVGHSCYWSSAPSRSRDSTEFLEFSLHPHVIVHAMHVTPYRAFWHPRAPCYGSRHVQFAFGTRVSPGDDSSSQDFEAFYTSDTFPLQNDMITQSFAMNPPVVMHSGRVRVYFIGKVQRQTLELSPQAGQPPEDLYYTCINQVSASGVFIHPQSDEDEEETVVPLALAIDDEPTLFVD